MHREPVSAESALVDNESIPADRETVSVVRKSINDGTST